MTTVSSPSRVFTILTECMRESACETLAALSGGDTSAVSTRAEDTPCDGVYGIISFVGDPCWSFMLGLPRQTAALLVQSFLGCELEHESADMADAIGEIANIIAGDLVARLESHGIPAAMSLPTVARGHDVELMLPHDTTSERLDFTSPAGALWARVVMARAEEASPRRGACPMCGHPV